MSVLSSEREAIEFYDAKERPYGVFSNYFVRSILVVPENPIDCDSQWKLQHISGLLLQPLAKIIVQYTYEMEDITYKSVEHFYQSMKFANSFEYRKVIQNANTPYSAYLLGRQQKSYRFLWQHEINKIIQQFQARGITIETSMVRDWDSQKLTVMLTGLREKFQQHADLANVLLSTRDATLKEASHIDSYFGTGKDGRGQNQLGKLLMTVRSELQSMNIPLGSLSSFLSITSIKHKRKRLR